MTGWASKRSFDVQFHRERLGDDMKRQADVMVEKDSGCVGRNNQQALRRMFAVPVQCVALMQTRADRANPAAFRAILDKVPQRPPITGDE